MIQLQGIIFICDHFVGYEGIRIRDQGIWQCIFFTNGGDLFRSLHPGDICLCIGLRNFRVN
jgi:hypothetical protein